MTRPKNKVNVRLHLSKWCITFPMAECHATHYEGMQLRLTKGISSDVPNT